MARRRIRPPGRGDGLFLLLVAAALGAALYDLAATVRHLARAPPDCRLALALTEYRRGGPGLLRRGPGEGVGGDGAPTNLAAATNATAFRGPAFPAAPGVVPLLLLPQRLDWSQRKANARHLLQDGVAQSPYLTWWGDPLPRSGAFPEGLVLVLDLLGARQVNKDWCRRTSTVIRALQQRRLAAWQQLPRLAAGANASTGGGTGLAPLPLAIVDNRDYPVLSYCPGLPRLLEPPPPHTWVPPAPDHRTLVRYSFRSAVLRRKWRPHLGWVRVGRLLLSDADDDNEEEEEEPEAALQEEGERNPGGTDAGDVKDHDSNTSGDERGDEEGAAADDDGDDDEDDEESYIEYDHRPIGVRTDIVQQVQEHLMAMAAARNQEEGMTAATRKDTGAYTHLCHPIEEMDRPIHVSYFWDHQNHARVDAHLRDTVYEILEDMASNDVSPSDRRRGWDFRLGVQGANRDKGRKSASPDYVAALLETQIVVVAQRDEWEDHYRLFEAIVAGAMVMTDTMLGLPHGLQDGESVVMYSNAQELRDRLAYYLAHHEERLRIAKQGRYIAMSMHRSWHHMEQIIFGRPLTACPSPPSTDDRTTRCPYVVNVDDMNLECPRPTTPKVANYS